MRNPPPFYIKKKQRKEEWAITITEENILNIFFASISPPRHTIQYK